MAVGIAGEGGEILDIGKKVSIYNQIFTAELREHLIEELGDLEFYMEGIRQIAKITREQTLQANYAKLAKRYKGHQYTDEQAALRNDKA
jgi:hypothetical protein